MPTRSTTKSSARNVGPSAAYNHLHDRSAQPASFDGPEIDGVGPAIPLVARVLAQDGGSGIAFSDFDDLLNAVKGRLIHTVSEPDTGGAATEQRTARVKTAVTECVAALDQLHATVTAELVRREALEQELFEAKASLAQTRTLLLGTQAGERRALHRASHDALTMLPNRGALIERLVHDLARPDLRRRRFALMFLDLDGFKPINDAHGHAVGDELLQVVAARLRRVVRAQDLVSRVGGDEFACLIGGLSDHASLAQLADKIADAVSAPCVLGALRLTVQVSIGIASCPADGSSPDMLIENADLAMYAAKRQRLRHVFFRPGGVAVRPRLRSLAPESPPPPRSCRRAMTVLAGSGRM